MKFKLGIIILTYDLLDVLQALLKNVFDYTSGDYVVYVVENGQKKSTIDWLKTQDVRTILGTNISLSNSWNTGIKESLKDGCTHFALLSDDISLEAGWWDACKKEFESGSHLVSVTPGVEHIIYAGWFYIIDREALDKVGYMDERFHPFYFEDLDYSYRFVQSGLKYSMADTKVPHLGSATILGNFQKKQLPIYVRAYRLNKVKFRHKYPHLKFKM